MNESSRVAGFWVSQVDGKPFGTLSMKYRCGRTFVRLLSAGWESFSSCTLIFHST